MFVVRLTCKECKETLQETLVVTKEIDTDISLPVAMCQFCRDRATDAAYQEGYEAGVEECG